MRRHARNAWRCLAEGWQGSCGGGGGGGALLQGSRLGARPGARGGRWGGGGNGAERCARERKRRRSSATTAHERRPTGARASSRARAARDGRATGAQAARNRRSASRERRMDGAGARAARELRWNGARDWQTTAARMRWLRAQNARGQHPHGAQAERERRARLPRESGALASPEMRAAQAARKLA